MTGTPTTEQQYLESYNIHDYEVPLCTVDMSIFTVMNDTLQVLLTRRDQHPGKGQWALPGGFINTQEDATLDDTACRKLQEKTGVTSPYLEQVASLGGSQRDPRGWAVTVLYFALISQEGLHLKPDASSTDVRWVPYREATSSQLAFDHNKLLQLSHERLRSKVLYTSLPVHLLPQRFTLPALQKTYEIILATPLQKKSFRKRFLDAGILQETGDKAAGISRPAALYQLVDPATLHVFPRTLESV